MAHETEQQKKRRPFSVVRWLFHHWRLTLGLIALGLIAFITWQVYRMTQGERSLLSISHTEAIEQTPEEVRKLRDIGEWEFLAVETEELIERHEAHTFGDKHLVKVYRGRLRIGIDMKQAGDDWFRGDSIVTASSRSRSAILTLPDVKLLDENFIDEARATTFYEKGTMSATTKQAMLDEAAATMKTRTLTDDNLATARQAAEEQFTRIFQAMGYDNVSIRFIPNANNQKQP